MARKTRQVVSVGCALIAASGVARADGDGAPPANTSDLPRREVVLAVGYGSIIAPSGIVVYRGVQSAERVPGFDGYSVDVTRRVSMFEVGARFWRMDDTSDGKGSSAHVLTRLTTEGRFYPWHFRTIEPWIGAELGLALADDFAVWSQAGNEPAHHATSPARPGLEAGVEAGARLRLASLVALGLRGGLAYLGFDRAGGPVVESPQTKKYSVQPIDYGQRMWLSVALTAEITVPD